MTTSRRATSRSGNELAPLDRVWVVVTGCRIHFDPIGGLDPSNDLDYDAGSDDVAIHGDATFDTDSSAVTGSIVRPTETFDTKIPSFKTEWKAGGPDVMREHT